MVVNATVAQFRSVATMINKKPAKPADKNKVME